MLDALEILSNSGVSAVVGAFVGAAASVITTMLANRAERKRGIEQRENDRKEKSRSFQIETYLDLQATLQIHARQTAKVFYQIAKQYSNGVPKEEIHVESDLDESILLSAQKLIRLEQRVKDTNLRTSIKELRMLSNDLQIRTQNSNSLWKRMESYSDKFEETMNLIGSKLRILIYECDEADK